MLLAFIGCIASFSILMASAFRICFIFLMIKIYVEYCLIHLYVNLRKVKIVTIEPNSLTASVQEEIILEEPIEPVMV